MSRNFSNATHYCNSSSTKPKLPQQPDIAITHSTMPNSCKELRTYPDSIHDFGPHLREH